MERTLYVGQCDCEAAQETGALIYAHTNEAHCEACGALIELTPLIGLTGDSTWVIPDNKYTAAT